ncbi:HU family DNA-binding protein [Ferruginibacter albus]|uniref:hypothetical protein n=1 Tax=Ferruginibacter albus TaxID=2875540 RepID=UPI001CC6B371|nr:hypothetical protein [Ferruginibacter albus]UAY52413.1 hypothetical protein K9M53_01665 [Ferruginibacter albus]
MQELINHLVEKVGLTQEQANGAIEAVKNFVKEKFPMLEGAVENLFSQQSGGTATDGSSSGIMDNITDKAEDFLGDLKGKFGL